MTTPHCETCRYFHLMGYDGSGQCRQVPPWVTTQGTRWPQVSSSDWCGKHQPAARPVPAVQDEETMSVPEAGKKFFGLSPNRAYQAALRGDIPSYKVGKRRRVPVAELREKLERATR